MNLVREDDGVRLVNYPSLYYYSLSAEWYYNQGNIGTFCRTPESNY